MLYLLSCISAGIILSSINKIFDLDLLIFKHNMSISVLIGISIIAYRILIRMIISYEQERISIQDSSNKSDKRNL